MASHVRLSTHHLLRACMRWVGADHHDVAGVSGAGLSGQVKVMMVPCLARVRRRPLPTAPRHARSPWAERLASSSATSPASMANPYWLTSESPVSVRTPPRPLSRGPTTWHCPWSGCSLVAAIIERIQVARRKRVSESVGLVSRAPAPVDRFRVRAALSAPPSVSPPVLSAGESAGGHAMSPGLAGRQPGCQRTISLEVIRAPAHP
jgi:hypothetical protein